ncbi:MAG: DUF484 family protein [Rhodospirillales bacterium]|nr:DUF484 family protein [Alphaproteobacteria bacterium]MCB1841165.1 DUF484 family protein [Alphaproteobacteria bacterium]MCB9977967.1 DUF484 family protein [Rhodospirillales bacterium]
MKETQTTIPPAPGLNEEEIVQYLKDHPDFLQKNPEACDLLIPPAHAQGRGIADFQTYMIERLKADKQEFEKNTKEFIENARSNMNNQQRVHKSVLCLLEATSFEDFIQTITMDISSILDVDISVLVVESNGREIPHVHQNGIRVVPEGTIDRWMKGKNVLLQEDISGIEAIYGGGATLVRSQILLRVDISLDTPPAIIAFGSRDPHLFHEGQATDQICFLARVIERCFRIWLNI